MSEFEVDIDQLEKARADGKPVIDVREPWEYEAGHVQGAKLIPLGQVMQRVSEVPRGHPVYVICQTGARSDRAAQWYRTQGIDAVNVAGGTKAWVEAGRDVIRGPLPD